MSFTYDALGEVTGMSQTVAGVNRSVGYAYANGDLTSLTTPSGQTVSYGYNANHQVTSIAVNGTTVLSSVSYEPFGPVNGWTWGNGNAFTRAFDGDGDISGISTSGSQETLGYDDASRISGITNTATGSSSWTYGYDQLDRLTGATSSSVTEGWTYDADGNRQSATGTSPSTYSISSTSNQITAIAGTLTRTYGYDAAGNTLSDSLDTDTYNDAGRLKTIANSSGTTTFIYNALGQMIEASGPSGITLYVYDQAGHLLGEYDGSGNLIQETVWLGDIPVATIRPNGASVAVYYVVTDQLDTPREVIRPSDNALMWTWFTGPFGVETSNENPQGIGNFTYDLRFPGQVAGAWGSSFQNYMRDYDPAVGRYVESDPIGLDGGINTYAYVGDNPLSRTDPLGLTWGDDWNMFWQWVSGTAPPSTLYGPGTNQSNDMMQSPGVADAVNYFNQKNAGKCPSQWVPVTNYDYKFGLKGLWQAGLNSTQQFVGSYSVNVYPNANGTLNVQVYNTTSMTSFLYGIYPNAWNPPNGWPLGNTSQEYEGTLPASTGATSCGCGSGSQ